MFAVEFFAFEGIPLCLCFSRLPEICSLTAFNCVSRTVELVFMFFSQAFCGQEACSGAAWGDRSRKLPQNIANMVFTVLVLIHRLRRRYYIHQPSTSVLLTPPSQQFKLNYLPAFWLDCSNGNGFVIVAVRLIQVSLLKQSSNLLSDNRDSGSLSAHIHRSGGVGLRV